jgi:hypothetical protein
MSNSPSVVNPKWIPSWWSQKASVSMPARTILKSFGARRQPCLTQNVTRKIPDSSPSPSTWNHLNAIMKQPTNIVVI